MKKVLKTILMGAVAFSLAMGVGCVTGENSSLEKESSKAEDSSSQNKRRQLRDKSDYGKVIALTFDDGPNTDTTPLVLDKLEEHGIVASFFVIGNNITDESAEVMKRAYNMGCDIENHSQSHPDMTKMTAEEIKAEIDFTSDKVEEAVGGTYHRQSPLALNSFPANPRCSLSLPQQVYPFRHRNHLLRFAPYRHRQLPLHSPLSHSYKKDLYPFFVAYHSTWQEA